MKFSKEKFLKYAGSQDKKRLKDHLELLDGREVECGCMIKYEVDGKKHLLYPVMDEWCSV